MALSHLSDAELWTLIKNDDYRAFLALFQRHWLKMYKMAIRYLHHQESSEEVIHDLFLNIWKRRKFLAINDFNNYFKATIRYQIYAYLKKRKDNHVLYTNQLPDKEGYYINKTDHKITSEELEYQLNNHLTKLPLRCKEIFLLSRMHHYTNQEIAEKLGITKRTVENQLTVALQYLRLNMKKIFFGISIGLLFYQ